MQIFFLVYQRICLDKDIGKYEDKQDNSGKDTDKDEDQKSFFSDNGKCQSH